MDVPRYFWYIILLYLFEYHIFYLSALVACWSTVSFRRIIYKFFNACPFDYTAVAVSGMVGIPLTGLPHQLGGYRYPNWPS